MLTKRQKQVLDYVTAEIKATGGVSPTFAMIQAASGCKSNGHLHSLLKAIESRGYIRRLPARDRAIEVLGQARQAKVTKQRCIPVPVMGYIDRVRNV